MTHNQILYWQNFETNRSNLAREAETQRSNMVREAETHRANTEIERANRAREKETERSNRAREKETERSNRANEMLTTLRRQQDFQIALWNRTLAYDQLAETKRSNKEHENTARINAQLNAEVQRASQEIQRQGQLVQAQIAANSLAEQNRANQAQERLSAQRNAETTRANMAQEELAQQRQSLATHQLTLDQQKAQELARHNSVVEQETHRANITREKIDTINATASLMSGAGNFMRGISQSGVISGASGKLRNLKEAVTLWQIRR